MPNLARSLSSPTGATIRQAGQTPRSATDPNALAQQALGWPLPVAGLRDWLQGFANDTSGKRVSASSDNTAVINTDDGWQLQYASWEPAVTGAGTRPKRIDLTRTTIEAGQVSIRIVIDTWQPTAL